MIRFYNQDETEKWMTCPTDFVEYPGLAYIYGLNQLIVAKKLDKLHNLTGEYDVGYTIYNNLGEKLFIAAQKKQAKQFQIKLYNIYGNEVIQITINSSCFHNKVYVFAPPGKFVGSVTQLCLRDNYELMNSEGTVVLLIVKGASKVYSVLAKGADPVGSVKKGWKEVPHENFGVSFPEDLGAGMKAVVLGACFLIGCMKY